MPIELDLVYSGAENALEVQDYAEQWLVEEIRFAVAVQRLFETLLEKLKRRQLGVEVMEDLLPMQNSRIRVAYCRSVEAYDGAASAEAKNLEGGSTL